MTEFSRSESKHGQYVVKTVHVAPGSGAAELANLCEEADEPGLSLCGIVSPGGPMTWLVYRRGRAPA